MLSRWLVCAIAMGATSPAFAHEGSHPAPPADIAIRLPDTMPLLLQDERATWGTPAALVQLAPGFNMVRPITLTAAPPMPDDLASFDALDSPAASYAYLPAPVSFSDTQLFAPATYRVTPGIRLTARDRAEPMGGATGALSVGNAIPRPYRPRRSPLDTMLVLRIDGEESSPPLTFGGGVASVLNVLPRQ